MVEFDIKINEKQRLAYIPRQLVKAFGLKLKLLPNMKCAVLYPEGENPETVVNSLKVILQDLELRVRANTIKREADP